MHTFVSNEEIEKRDKKKREALSPVAEKIQSGLFSYIQQCLSAAENHHMDKVRPVLEDCLRRKKGEYDDAKLEKIKQLNGAELYLKHSGMKARAAKSWIKEVILPGGKKPWGVDPTPIPDLPDPVEDSIIAEEIEIARQHYAVQGVAPTEEEISEVVKMRLDAIRATTMKKAKKVASRMEKKIKDNFTESDFESEVTKFIDDVVTYPFAVLKGPTVENKKRLAYTGNEFKPTVVVEPKTSTRRISPFDFYFSPDATNLEEGYCIEKMRLSKADLQAMKNIPGCSSEKIEEVLKAWSEAPKADDFNEGTRKALENRETQATRVAGSNDDRATAYEYWGTVEANDLNDWAGKQIATPDSVVDVSAIMIGDKVIKAILNPNPLGKKIYYLTSYEEQTDSIMGNGVIQLMAPIQDAMNAVMRALIDNVGFASGPQVIEDLDRIHPSQLKTAHKIWPRKIWLTQSAYGSTSSPIDFQQPKIITDQLMRVLTRLEQYSDDHTGIPAYTYGNESVGGAGETASGLSMLLNAASKGIRQVIGNIGKNVIRPRIEAEYTWLMLYDKDTSIKGDCQISARGLLAEVMREEIQNKRQMFISQFITPEVVMQIIGQEGVEKIVRKHFDELEMDDVLPPEGTPQPALPAEAGQVPEGQAA